MIVLQVCWWKGGFGGNATRSSWIFHNSKMSVRECSYSVYFAMQIFALEYSQRSHLAFIFLNTFKERRPWKVENFLAPSTGSTHLNIVFVFLCVSVGRKSTWWGCICRNTCTKPSTKHNQHNESAILRQSVNWQRIANRKARTLITSANASVWTKG